MYKNILQSIVGVEIYAIISMLLFTAVLVGMIVYVLHIATSTMKFISRLPLDGDDGMHWN